MFCTGPNSYPLSLFPFRFVIHVSDLSAKSSPAEYFPACLHGLRLGVVQLHAMSQPGIFKTYCGVKSSLKLYGANNQYCLSQPNRPKGDQITMKMDDVPTFPNIAKTVLCCLAVSSLFVTSAYLPVLPGSLVLPIPHTKVSKRGFFSQADFLQIFLGFNSAYNKMSTRFRVTGISLSPCRSSLLSLAIARPRNRQQKR